MKTVIIALLLSVPLSAQRISAPKPKVHHSHQVWVLMVMENHGATVYVAGVARTQADAQALESTLPAPSADRVCVAVPSVLKGRSK